MDLFSAITDTSDAAIRELLLANLPDGNFKRIFLKPNWVKHQENDAFPIAALVTDCRLIDATIQACVTKYKKAERIAIGDVPLQSCEFDLLARQSGLDKLIEKYRNSTAPAIQFFDLRRERWKVRDGFMQMENDVDGDPLGYVDVVLNEQSLLEEVSDNAQKFRVSDYDPKETASVHCKGMHSYRIARSVLDADLFINMPKMKTHQKAGITGALKNLVGINGAKAYLVHHQKGIAGKGGDEFPPDVDSAFVVQARLKERLQKRSRFLFKPLKMGWELVKKAKGIQTSGTRENLNGNFYVGAGSWYGNDSIWRMVYDLNMIILFASSNGGSLKEDSQREYVTVLDGIVAGEGNGPLQPLPVMTNLIAIANNPFVMDFAMAKMMGFDHKKIRSLNNFRRMHKSHWTNFEPEHFRVHWNGNTYDGGIGDVPILHHFLPSPGWRNHIELGK